MEHKNSANFPPIGEDSRFETNSAVNPFQSPDNLLSGHEVLREGKSCGSSHSRSTSAFQNFSVPIDLHLQNQLDLSWLYRVSESAREDLIWWANLKESSCTKSLFEPQTQTVVESKASRIRWGTIHEGVSSSGICSKEVTVPHHINEQEMLAGENALHNYFPKIPGKFVQVKCDNSTVVHYLKNQGGTKSFSLCDMALEFSTCA